MGDRISDLKDRNIEIIQLEEERELRFFKVKNPRKAIGFDYKGKYKYN